MVGKGVSSSILLRFISLGVLNISLGIDSILSIEFRDNSNLYFIVDLGWSCNRWNYWIGIRILQWTIVEQSTGTCWTNYEGKQFAQNQGMDWETSKNIYVKFKQELNTPNLSFDILLRWNVDRYQWLIVFNYRHKKDNILRTKSSNLIIRN